MKLRNHVIELLQRIGLNKSDAKFFMAVYQHPQLTIKDLINFSKLSRPTAYRSYERLKTLGLITSSENNWRKNIEAVSLKTIAHKMAKEQRKLRKIELELQHLDNLIKVSSLSEMEDPVEILTDKNKIIEKNYEILHQPWDRLFCYGSGERLVDILGDHEYNFKRIRVQKGRPVNVVVTEVGDYTKELLKVTMKEIRDMKVQVDPKNQDYITYMYENEVAIWHHNKEQGSKVTVIRDTNLVKNYEGMFKNMWEKI